jgi:hypothetical protein
MKTSKAIIPIERIERSILLIRGEKVMLDSALAALYGVKLKALNQAVKRNELRFPGDFMFQLDADESARIWSQIVTKSRGVRSHRGYRPFAFTELGVAMLSSVLRSERAVRVNIDIMRTFVHLRRLLADNVELRTKLDALEKKYDKQFSVVFAAIRKLMDPDDPTTPTRGFAR